MSIASVKSDIAGGVSEVNEGDDPSKRRRTVDLALISLVTNLAYKQRNAFLPIYSNIHGIIMVAEKTCERSVYRGKGDQQQSSALSFKRTYQEVPSFSGLLASATTFFVYPSLCATAVVVVGVDVRGRT